MKRLLISFICTAFCVVLLGAALASGQSGPYSAQIQAALRSWAPVAPGCNSTTTPTITPSAGLLRTCTDGSVYIGTGSTWVWLGGGSGASSSPLTITTDGTVGAYALVAPQTVVIGGVAYPAPGKWVATLPEITNATTITYVDLVGASNGIIQNTGSLTTFALPAFRVSGSGVSIYGGDGSLTVLDLSALEVVNSGLQLANDGGDDWHQLTALDLSSLVATGSSLVVGGSDANFAALASIDLSALETVGADLTISGISPSLTEISLPSLTSAQHVAFNSADWSALTSISAPLLTTANSVTIDSQNAPLLTTLAFPALTTLTNGEFSVARNSTSSLAALASIDLSALVDGQVVIGGNSAADLSSLSSLTLKPASTVSLSLRGVQTGWTTMDLSAVTSIGSISFGDGDAAFTGTNLTDIDLSNLTTIGGLNLGQNGDDLSSLASIDLSSLTSVTDGDLRIANGVPVDNLTALDLSSVETVTGTVALAFGGASSGLASIDLSGLQSVGSDFGVGRDDSYGVDNYPALTTITLTSALLSIGGDVFITNCALNQASVDNILVRLAALDGTGGTTSYDNHTVTFTFGEIAPPSATGLAAKATLEGRGNEVYINRTFAITAAAADPVNTITISGDHTDVFTHGVQFQVFGSTGNDGVWTVDSAAFGAGVTVITIDNGPLPDSTGDGTIRVATTIG